MEHKNSQKGVLIAIIIAVSAILIYCVNTYVDIILRQLPSRIETEPKTAFLDLDSEVREAKKKMQNSTDTELIKFANQQYSEKRFKIAYNINKIILEKAISEKSPIVAVMYGNISECYRAVGNTKAAVAFSNIAERLLNEKVSEMDTYIVRYEVAAAYYDNCVNEGMRSSTQAAEKLEKVLSMDIKKEGWKDTQEDIYRNALDKLERIYGSSSVLSDREKAHNYYRQSIEMFSSDSARYAMAYSYLEVGMADEAYRYWRGVKRDNKKIEDDLAIKTFYHISKGNMLKAGLYRACLRTVSISKVAEQRYSYVSCMYYQKLGKTEKAKGYLEKIIEMNKYNVYDSSFIDLETELNMSFDDVRAELAKEYEKNSRITLELGGAPWETGLPQ